MWAGQLADATVDWLAACRSMDFVQAVLREACQKYTQTPISQTEKS